MLYRLSISEQRGQCLLKGALLFDIWFDVPHRPTHDADLLGFGSTEIPHLEKLFREISQIASDDGIAFQADSVKAVEIRKEANYAGVRVTMLGLLDGALSGADRHRLRRRRHARPGRCAAYGHPRRHAAAATEGSIPATPWSPKSWKRWSSSASSTAE